MVTGGGVLLSLLPRLLSRDPCFGRITGYRIGGKTDWELKVWQMACFHLFAQATTRPLNYLLEHDF